MKLYIYTRPPESSVQLILDTGITTTSDIATSANGRNDAHVLELPGDTPRQGAALSVDSPGQNPFDGRGIIIPAGTVAGPFPDAKLLFDDVHLTPIATAPPGPTTPPPSGPPNPVDIINRVYVETQAQLWTHEGCGKFTEDCCAALHTEHSPAWGHKDKDEGQNQYNGHALDAIMLAMNVPGTQSGVYDIIYASVSPEAKPAFTLVGPMMPSDYEDWVYPPGAETRGNPTVVAADDIVSLGEARRRYS